MNQTEKDRYCMHLYEISKLIKHIEIENRLESTRCWGEMQNEKYLLNGTEFYLGWWKVLGNEHEWWLHNIANILSSIQLYFVT